MWERLPENTKNKSVFVVGPWGHSVRVSDTAEYSLEKGNLPTSYDYTIVNFFNSIRNNSPYNEFNKGKVNYYSIGGDFWTTDETKTQSMKLYFNNDNTLSEKMTIEGEQSYIYDPNMPLTCFKHHDIFKAQPAGAVDGVLSFVSAPFKERGMVKEGV